MKMLTRERLQELLTKIESYPFESQGGDLRLCEDWQILKAEIERLEAACQEKDRSWLKANHAVFVALDKIAELEATVERLTRDKAELDAEHAHEFDERTKLLKENRRLREALTALHAAAKKYIRADGITCDVSSCGCESSVLNITLKKTEAVLRGELRK